MAINGPKFDFKLPGFGGFNNIEWNVAKRLKIKRVKKLMKRIKVANDKRFNSLELIKIDGANYSCNGYYEKILEQKSLNRFVWKLRFENEE